MSLGHCSSPRSSRYLHVLEGLTPMQGVPLQLCIIAHACERFAGPNEPTCRLQATTWMAPATASLARTTTTVPVPRPPLPLPPGWPAVPTRSPPPSMPRPTGSAVSAVLMGPGLTTDLLKIQQQHHCLTDLDWQQHQLQLGCCLWLAPIWWSSASLAVHEKPCCQPRPLMLHSFPPPCTAISFLPPQSQL